MIVAGRRYLIGLLTILVVLTACGGGRTIVGAGTTIVDSGLMAELETAYGGEISVVAGSTAEILQLARQGAVAAAIVHDPVQELEYVAAHPNTPRLAVFSSRFLIVGDPVLVAEAPADPSALMSWIADNGHPFVTRGDDSGTHVRELALWEEARVEPDDGDWYVSTGQGMGLTLQVADQRGAFTLVEEGAYLSAADTIGLVPVTLDEVLANPYHALVFAAAGVDFVEWLAGPDGQDALKMANNRVFGGPVYVPSESGS